MLWIFCLCVIIFIINHYRDLSLVKVAVALNLGAIIACFSGPLMGLLSVLAFAYLASNKDQ